MTAPNVSVWTQSFGLYKEERGLWILKEMNRERLQEKNSFYDINDNNKVYNLDKSQEFNYFLTVSHQVSNFHRTEINFVYCFLFSGVFSLSNHITKSPAVVRKVAYRARSGFEMSLDQSNMAECSVNNTCAKVSCSIGYNNLSATTQDGYKIFKFPPFPNVFLVLYTFLRFF